VKIRGIFFLSAILLFLTACGGSQPLGIHTQYSPRQIAESIIAEQSQIAPMNYLVPDGEFFWDFISDRYQINTSKIEILDGIIFYAGGVIADEIAVLLLADKANVPVIRDLLLDYANRRRIAFSGYAPVQAGVLANSVVSVNGNHVALLISEDSRGAEAAFLASFSGNLPGVPKDNNLPQTVSYNGHYHVEQAVVPNVAGSNREREFANPVLTELMPVSNGQSIPPEKTEHAGEAMPREAEISAFEHVPAEGNFYPGGEVHTIGGDVYDRRSILLAWNTGDASELSPMNRRVFNKCAYVIDSVITDGMSGFDKQLAIINWIIMWAVYDPEFLSNSPTASPDPNNDNPYGVLFSRVGNCYGFTYTFQLFMDLLGIESVVVHGYDFTTGRHAWNLVHLYGSWYAVDVTLDVTLNNPIGVDISHRPEYIIHRHLNLTSEYLWNVLGHYWDWFSVPIAE